MAMRSKKGNPTAEARDKTGMKGSGKKGKFPVFDEKSAISALKLRNHGKGVSAGSVVAKVRGYANRTGSSKVKAALKRIVKKEK